MLTPSDIEVLIWCHVMPERHPRYDAPAVQDALRRFEKGRFITKVRDSFKCGRLEDYHYITLPRGEKLVQMLCETPYPEEVFIDPRKDK